MPRSHKTSLEKFLGTFSKRLAKGKAPWPAYIPNETFHDMFSSPMVIATSKRKFHYTRNRVKPYYYTKKMTPLLLQSCPELHMGGVTRWNSHFSIHTWTFLAIISVAPQLFLCLFWVSLWLKNRYLQHPCFKNLCKIAQAPKNSDSSAQHFPFGFANTFMISLHALCTPKLPIPLYCHE